MYRKVSRKNNPLKIHVKTVDGRTVRKGFVAATDARLTCLTMVEYVLRIVPGEGLAVVSTLSLTKTAAFPMN